MPMEEKDYSADESDYPYSSSSRSSIHSDTHILRNCEAEYESHSPTFQYSPTNYRTSFYYSRIKSYLWQSCCVCTPRRCTRYFNLTILSTIILVIFILTRQSWSSSQDVGLGLKKQPPPPPIWEKFPLLKRYYGGVRNLVSVFENIPEYPADHEARNNQNSTEDQAWTPKPVPQSLDLSFVPEHNYIIECFLDMDNKVKVPRLRAYNGIPSGMPDSVMGSYNVLGLRDDVCFDRFGKLGPYGLGYEKKLGGSSAGMEGDREGADYVWSDTGRIDYGKVKWNDAQERCLELNKDRFLLNSDKAPKVELYQSAHSDQPSTSEQKTNATTSKRDTTKLPRKAVIIRTWSDYNYDDEDMFYLRSLIWELSLQTGGEYTVHFLIHVRDNNVPIWADESIYNKVLNQSLPQEFQGMGSLWSEPQMGMIYNNLPDNYFRDLPLHGVFRSHFMALTWFAYQHPEFDQYWQFEMDLRYIGDFYELISKSSQWAAVQPRKFLWERNARFYVPSEHGSWEDFSHMVRVQTEHGTATKSNLYSGLSTDPDVPESIKSELNLKVEKSIWGPERPVHDNLDNSSDINPPHSFSQDKSEWGVGEQADLITFNPLFDPQGTDWLLANDVTGYSNLSPIPRRAAVTTFGAFSKRLLLQMHKEMVTEGKHMFTEMFPATVALHHGFKAVYVPHPVFVEREWPTQFLASTFNGGRNGQSGGSRYSVFSHEREHNFRGTSWYYNADFAERLWKRWLGYRVDGEGGEAAETTGEGRMCLRSVLLHPVKQVDLVYREDGGEEDGT
jgi:Protein of unknown function (DUF3405)